MKETSFAKASNEFNCLISKLKMIGVKFDDDDDEKTIVYSVFGDLWNGLIINH